MPVESGNGRVDVGLITCGEKYVDARCGKGFRDATADALRRCRLTVQISTKLNRSHVTPGDAALIIPCLGRTEIDRTGGREQFVTVEDSMSEVHASQGRVEPAAPDLRSEVAIVAGIGEHALGSRVDVDWRGLSGDYAAIREHIAAVIPGYERFNERARTGFTLPHPPRDSRTFTTATGKARLTVNTADALVIPAGRLLLQTLRSHDQYNTTIYGLDDRYRGIEGGRRVVFCNRDDLAELGVADGAIVDLVSEWADQRERRAASFRVVGYDIARRTCAAYGSNTPTSKAVIVRLEPR